VCKEKNWVAEATKELVERQLRAEVAQISGCSEKLAHPSFIPASIHPSIPLFIGSWILQFIGFH